MNSVLKTNLQEDDDFLDLVSILDQGYSRRLEDFARLLVQSRGHAVATCLSPRVQQINTEIFREESVENRPFQKATDEPVVVDQLLQVIRQFLRR